MVNAFILIKSRPLNPTLNIPPTPWSNESTSQMPFIPVRVHQRQVSKSPTTSLTKASLPPFAPMVARASIFLPAFFVSTLGNVETKMPASSPIQSSASTRVQQVRQPQLPLSTARISLHYPLASGLILVPNRCPSAITQIQRAPCALQIVPEGLL